MKVTQTEAKSCGHCPRELGEASYSLGPDEASRAGSWLHYWLGHAHLQAPSNRWHNLRRPTQCYLLRFSDKGKSCYRGPFPLDMCFKWAFVPVEFSRNHKGRVIVCAEQRGL